MRAPVFSSNWRLVSAISAAAPEKHSLIELQVHLAVAHRRVIQDGVVQRRHAAEERRLHLLDGLQQVVEVARVRHQRQRIRADERQRLHADVAVDVEQRQRQHDHVGPRRLGRLGPVDAAAGRRRRSGGAGRPRLSACRWCRRSTGSPRGRRGRTATPAGARRDAARSRSCSQQVARLERDAVAVLLLLEQGEQDAEHRRQVLLDRRGDRRAARRCGPGPA